MGANPPWSPDYAAENSSQPLLNVCISFAILETFIIIAFIFSWYFDNSPKSNLKPVLYMILVGYVFCFAGVVLGILKITMGGAGYHADTLRPQTLRVMLKLVKAHEFVYVSSVLFPKLAILCLYFRLFNSRTMHYIIYATGLLLIGTFTFGIVLSFANCRPFASFWDRTLEGHCSIDVMAVFRYYSIPNIVSDVILLILPLPALRKLSVGLLTKIGLYLTFLAMTFGIVTAVLRFVSFLEVDLFNDITYRCVTTTSWTIIEPGTYLVAATIPTLRPLIRRFFKRANGFCPPPSKITSCFRDSTPSIHSVDIAEPKRALLKKSYSSMSLRGHFRETIGHRPSRLLDLDTYHHIIQDQDVASPISIDEESLVCMDARCQERFASQGRNPDGTLTTWSLQPVSVSPMRTSFFLENE